MSKTFDQGKDEVAKLCQYFATNRQSFLAPGVKEAHVRQSLIDPFFEALGWDVRNASMAAPQYREVIPEDSLEVEGQQKAPDYTFRVGTLPKFYVEAKKCGVNISADPAQAYQLRRYGFSAKLALSILTDFEELGVYDCGSRPRPTDKASHARIQYFGFSEYPDRWREIWDVFSRESVWSGTFDQYAASKRKRGTSEVDSEFLKDIEGWRDALARNLALRNGDLLVDDLNAAVQRIIDRIVFLRMAEDRGLESCGQLLKLCERPKIYDRFMSELCRKADEKYNSGLFHFQKEPGVSDAPDTLTPRLVVEDNAIKPILQSLYFEHGCPYHFGVLPVEILGTVYERFLGKVIRLTAGHQAKVEEKPEVRKAGGVYYTPSYIVNYIVLNTIGTQIEGKSPADLAGGKTTPPFRVLDMACGSGSFLLGAYQFLLDHCLKWHQSNLSKKHAKAVYQNAKGETRLTIGERKRILTTHIYGVDIDRQAVETTKLSLLLKALEGENDTTLSRQMTLFHERALPNLSDNIKCGNSLIASDFSIIPEDLVRVRAFDWLAQFPDAMKAGGFDAVIGNPPYIFTRNQGIPEDEKAYFYLSYKHQSVQLNTFGVFLERAHQIVRPKGFVGFITPNNWLTIDTFSPLRKFILTQTGDVAVINILERVFEAANVDTCVVVLVKKPPTTLTVAEMQRQVVANVRTIPSVNVVSPKYIVQIALVKDEGEIAVMRKIESVSKPLSELSTVSTGLKVYQTGKGKPKQTDRQKCDRVFHADRQVNSTYGRYLDGVDVSRYHLDWSREWLSYGEWIAEPRRSVPFSGPRLLVRQIPSSPPYLVHGVFTVEACYNDINSMIVFSPKVETSLKFLLGVLNSRAVSFWFQKTFDKLQRKIFPQFKVRELASFPIPAIDLSNPTKRARHDKLVELVDKMLALTPKLRGATAESEKAALQNAVTTTDAEIDRLVYELYGLTEEEIKIVEDEC